MDAPVTDRQTDRQADREADRGDRFIFFLDERYDV